MNATNIQPVKVEVVPTTDGSIEVRPIWEGVDRPYVGGWVVRDKRIAVRLAFAIRAGVVYKGGHIETDVNGKTYVCASAMVLGRHLNADLKRLGF